MSWSISRIRLSQIGPATARYEGILDLRNSSGGAADSVALRLVNQGGKGVLLQHMLNVLVPGQRGIIGEKETWTKLGKFVLDTDLAHLAIEWRRADELLITGKTMRWRHGHPSSDSRDLLVHFYCFRPDGLTLETLPFVREGQRLNHVDFHRVLTDALSEHARGDHEAVQTTEHGKWIAALRDRGIDSDLFRYQVRMNHQEGGADQLLTSLKTNETFLRFFVEILADEDELKQLTAMVAAQRTALARRELVAAEAEICQRLADVAAPLLPLATELEAAEARMGRARRDAQLLWLSVQRTRAQSEAELPTLNEQRRQAASDMTAARREQSLARLERFDAQVQAAERELREAEDAVVEENAAVTRRERHWKAWRAALPLSEVAAVEAQLRAIAAAEEQLDRAAAPLRERAERAGSQLRRALTRAIEALDLEIEGADERIATEQGRAASAREQADAAQGTVASLERQLADARRRHGELARDRERLVRDDILPAGVRASDHLPTVTGELEAATRLLEQLRERLPGAEREADRTRAERESATGLLAATETAAQTARDALAAVELGINSVTALASLAAALGQSEGSVSLWSDPGESRERLGQYEQRAQLQLAGHLAEEHAQREVAERIAADPSGLVPPDEECRTVLDAIAARAVTGASGWRYIHQSRQPADWQSALAQAGSFAGCVVLTSLDSGEADRLVTELGDRLESLRRAVPVLTSDEFERLLGDEKHGPANTRAVWGTAGLVDPLAAERHRTTLEETLARSAGRQAELEGAVREATELRLACVGLWEHYPADPRPDARTALTEAGQAIVGSQASLRRAIDAEAEATDALEGLRGRIREAEGQHRRFELASLRLEPVASTEQRLSGPEHDLDTLTTRLAAERDARTSARDEENAAAAAERTARDEHRSLSGDRAARVAERAAITVPASEESAEDAPPPDLLHARSDYLAAVERWRSASTDEQLAAQRRRAESTLADAQRDRDAFAADALAEARQLLADGHADAHRRAAGEERAHQLLAAEQEALGAAKSSRDETATRRDQALAEQQTVQEELASAGQKRALDESERTVYATAAEARAGAHAAAQRESEADRRRNRAASQETGLRDRIQRAEQRAATCRRLLARLPAHPDPEAHAEPLTDEIDALDQLVEEAAGALQRAEVEIVQIHSEQSEVARRLRDIALDQTYADEAARQLRQTIVAHGEPLELARWATQTQPQIAARGASSAQELEHLDRRTSGVVDFYAQLTARFTGLLRRLAAVSRMPDGLGGWSGRSFIAASMPSKPTDAALRDRIERALSVALASDQESRLRGPELLFRAIIAACDGRAPTIRFLKPDIGLPYQPVPLGEGMSGGQGVTAAVALYCSLANLRREALAIQLTARGGGALLLDNPFGKTTSAELLSIMFSVAERLGVQLVCLTPSTEDAVVDRFEVMLQLRNSRGVRDGLRHVRVQEVRHRDALAQSDGTISAARLTREQP